LRPELSRIVIDEPNRQIVAMAGLEHAPQELLPGIPGPDNQGPSPLHGEPLDKLQIDPLGRADPPIKVIVRKKSMNRIDLGKPINLGVAFRIKRAGPRRREL